MQTNDYFDSRRYMPPIKYSALTGEYEHKQQRYRIEKKGGQLPCIFFYLTLQCLACIHNLKHVYTSE